MPESATSPPEGGPTAVGGADAVRVLHEPDRSVDAAVEALARVPEGAFLHLLVDHDAPAAALPAAMAASLAHGRWLPKGTHLMKLIDQSDHLRLHQVWLEACRGATRVARATVRMVRPLAPGDGRPEGPVGTYEVQFIDLIGVDGFDAVAVTITPGAGQAPDPEVTPPPTGTATFRLHLTREGVVVDGAGPVHEVVGCDVARLRGTMIAERVHEEDALANAGAWEDVISVPEVPVGPPPTAAA